MRPRIGVGCRWSNSHTLSPQCKNSMEGRWSQRTSPVEFLSKITKLHEDLTKTGYIAAMRIEPRPPELRLPRAHFPAEPHDDAEMREPAQYEQTPARLNDSHREAPLLNIDVSLRVHTRPQLFSWVQGALQSMIPHEVLVCGLQESRQSSLRVDSFSTAPVDCARLNELFQQDVSLVPHLIKVWEENRCQAVLCETERGPLAGAALAREFSRLCARPLLPHSQHGATRTDKTVYQRGRPPSGPRPQPAFT